MGFAPGLDIVRSAVRAHVTARSEDGAGEASAVPRIVTISRQAGTGAGAVAQRLAQRLDEMEPAGGSPWIAYDRALVERVAEDHNVSRDLVASMDEHDKTWFEHFTAGIAGLPTGTDIALKMAETIRGVARIGRAIIVGRGGQCILGETPGAVHVRLVAPLAWRVRAFAQTKDISESEAEKAIVEIDRVRATFLKSHFHVDVADPELYTLVINRARLSVDEAAGVVAGLVAAG